MVGSNPSSKFPKYTVEISVFHHSISDPAEAENGFYGAEAADGEVGQPPGGGEGGRVETSEAATGETTAEGGGDRSSTSASGEEPADGDRRPDLEHRRVVTTGGGGRRWTGENKDGG
jgi:hypothetical protein